MSDKTLWDVNEIGYDIIEINCLKVQILDGNKWTDH